MGTRHLQTVITKEGDIKVNQYGQWDGYPDGQGIDILEFLRNCDLAKYQENLSKLRRITQKEGKEIDKLKDWDVKHPHLSRDCGSRIHKMIERGEIEFVQLADKDAESWCEGFYTVDFSKDEFVAEFHGNVRTYKISSLPSYKKFLDDFKGEDE